MCIATDDEHEEDTCVKCLIAESKKGMENAGTQTRAEAYAMLGNKIVERLQKREVVNSAVGYGIVNISFNNGGNVTFENSTLHSTTTTAAWALHY